jgi:hypothetical protein
VGIGEERPVDVMPCLSWDAIEHGRDELRQAKGRLDLAVTDLGPTQLEKTALAEARRVERPGNLTGSTT